MPNSVNNSNPSSPRSTQDVTTTSGSPSQVADTVAAKVEDKLEAKQTNGASAAPATVTTQVGLEQPGSPKKATAPTKAEATKAPTKVADTKDAETKPATERRSVTTTVSGWAKSLWNLVKAGGAKLLYLLSYLNPFAYGRGEDAKKDIQDGADKAKEAVEKKQAGEAQVANADKEKAEGLKKIAEGEKQAAEATADVKAAVAEGTADGASAEASKIAAEDSVKAS